MSRRSTKQRRAAQRRRRSYRRRRYAFSNVELRVSGVMVSWLDYIPISFKVSA